MFRNLKFVKNVIEDYFNNHPQINSLYHGDTDNLSTYKDIQYPFCNYEYIDSNYQGNNINNVRWQIAFGDLSDDETEFDCVDRCNEIGQDFLKFLESHQDLEFQANVLIVPFNDSFADRVSGVTFTVTFIQHRNNCKFV